MCVAMVGKQILVLARILARIRNSTRNFSTRFTPSEKQKTAFHMEALHRFPPIYDQVTASGFERFADLLQVAQINLQDVGRQDELGNGTFCTQMQQKLNYLQTFGNYVQTFADGCQKGC